MNHFNVALGALIRRAGALQRVDVKLDRWLLWTMTLMIGLSGGLALADQVVVYPDKDTRITRNHPGRDDGLNPRIYVQKWEKQKGYLTGRLKGIVNFPIADLAGTTVVRAHLQFRNVVKPNYGRGRRGTLYGVRRMLRTDWVEGNRKSNNHHRRHCGLRKQAGSGVGMTWDCFIDTDISNALPDCPEQYRWYGARISTLPGDSLVAPVYTDVLEITPNTQANGSPPAARWTEQILEWDVTADVVAAMQEAAQGVGWMLERANHGRGKVKVGSREWADACEGDPDMGPRLVVEIE